MILVEEIWDDAKEIFGHSNTRKLFRQIADAVELLANKGEIDPLIGDVDICVTGQCISLPREVETPLAVNIGGHPALGRDDLFDFHLNGPGDNWHPCGWTWTDQGNFCTYRDLVCPGKLISFLDREEDSGKLLRVWGYDDQGRELQTNVGGVWQSGYRVPTIFGYAVPDASAQTVARITAIYREPTLGHVRLSTFDNSTFTGTLLGVFEPDETKPQYRRIRINEPADWVRVKYRKRSAQLRFLGDRILIHSRPALLLAMRAIKKYEESDLSDAVLFEANAVRLLTERESVITSPTMHPMQVDDRASIKLHPVDDID